MAALVRFFLLITCIVLFTQPLHAADKPPDNFATWLKTLKSDAIAHGISPITVQSALDVAFLDERVIDLDRKQPETRLPFDTYLERIISPDRIKEGRNQYRKHEDILDKIFLEYGVQPEVIIALWAVESSFGKHKGNYNVIDSLMTLAFEGRRADFFRNELFNALHILDKDHIPATALRGSWAGAMGQCQFMPSTFLSYAVDYDHSGHRDIWGHLPDVFASIANYIAAEGWQREQSWGTEVQLTVAIPEDRIGLDQTSSLQTWDQLGVRNLNGSSLDINTIQASLIQPDGMSGRSFLVYDNFRALLKWNRSTYFATAVGLLADRIK